LHCAAHVVETFVSSIFRYRSSYHGAAVVVHAANIEDVWFVLSVFAAHVA